MPNLYIISGCNGAGKTTASFTVLPEMLQCREFVNADAIAAALSPFNPDGVAIEAGRIMLHRITHLLGERVDFAIETTLATRIYVSTIKKAQEMGYRVSLLYFWLDSPEFAQKRVAKRVSEGGHNIPFDVIKRRYYGGIHNLAYLYMPVVDDWRVVNNTDAVPDTICYGNKKEGNLILNPELWDIIQQQSKSHGS